MGRKIGAQLAGTTSRMWEPRGKLTRNCQRMRDEPNRAGIRGSRGPNTNRSAFELEGSLVRESWAVDARTLNAAATQNRQTALARAAATKGRFLDTTQSLHDQVTHIGGCLSAKARSPGGFTRAVA